MAFQNNAFQNDAFQIASPFTNFGWHQPLSSSPRLKTANMLAVAVIASSVGLFVPAQATQSNTTTVLWPLTQGERARPIMRVAPQGHHLFVPKEAVLENTTCRVWPLTQGEKARPIPRNAPLGHHLFVPREATSDNTGTVTSWMRPFDAPLYRPGSLRFNIGLAGPGTWYPDITSAYSLFSVQASAVFTRSFYYDDINQPQAYYPLVPATNNVVTPLPLTFGEAARPIPRNGAPQGYHLFVPKEATVENTTNRVWPLTFGEQARPIPRAAQQGSHLFVPREATIDNTTNRVWPLAFGEIARPIPRPAQQGFSDYKYPYLGVDNTGVIVVWPLQLGYAKAVPIPRPAPLGGAPFVPREAVLDNTTNRVWPLHQGEVARPILRPAPPGGQPFVPKDAVLDNTTNVVWPLAFGEIARPIPRNAPVGGAPFIPKEAVLENTRTISWPLTFGEKARPIVRFAPLGGQPFLPSVATVDNTTNTVWPLTQGEKARPIMRVAPQGFWVFGYPYLTLDTTGIPVAWPLQIGWPKAVPIPYVAPQGGAPFVPAQATRDNTTNTVWPLTFGEKARPIPLVAPQGYWSFGYPYIGVDNTGTPVAWPLQLGYPKAVPIPRTAPLGGQPFVPREATVNNTVPGGWWQDFRLPSPRRPVAKTNLTYTTIFFAAPPNTVTPDKWLMRFDPMPRFWPAKPDLWFPRHPEFVVEQSVSADFTLSVTFHVCGWGTETQEGDAAVEQTEDGDAFVEQTPAVDASVEQAEDADPWGEQTQSDDDFDEQGGCGS